MKKFGRKESNAYFCIQKMGKCCTASSLRILQGLTAAKVVGCSGAMQRAYPPRRPRHPGQTRGALPRTWLLARCRGCGCLLRVAFCLGFFVASCCGSSEMSHAIPVQTLQILKSYRWNCNVLGRCRKFGYPNCTRLMVDEARQANSCVRTSAHGTVHDPRGASTCPVQLRCRGLRCHP